MINITSEILSSITSANKSKWNSFICRSPLTSMYYRYEFLKAVEETTTYNPRHIVIFKDGNIIGVFPHFIQHIPGLPFKILFSMNPGYGGPLIGKHEPDVFSLMMKQIPKLCKKTILAHYIQTQHPGFIRYHQFLTNSGYRLNIRYSHAIIPLKNRTYEDIKKGYHDQRRHQLHKTKQENISIIDEPVTTESLTSFHQGYKQTMKRVNGAPLPLPLILGLHKYLPNRLKLVSISLNNNHIGQHLYLIDKESNTLIAWILSIKEKHHTYHPSTLLHDYMIQWAIENKCNTYDFEYTLANFQDGLFKYKEEFGTQATPLLSWEKSYSIIPLRLIKIGGKLYKRYQRSEQ